MVAEAKGMCELIPRERVPGVTGGGWIADCHGGTAHPTLKKGKRIVTIQGRGIQRGGRQAERVADGTFLVLLLERGYG